MARHDPGARPEDEGIPDLQDGTPEQQVAQDPEQMAVPVDEPVAAEEWGTTTLEQQLGKPLEDRLREEEPESDLGPGTARDWDDEAEDTYGPAEPRAGRLVERRDGRPGRDQDSWARTEDAELQGGLTAEEEAMHVTDADRAVGPAPDEEEEEEP
ncbi:DUF5709 domain-containing protein [Allostreptomyces psammosilenae]|uniref:DUF5709 domain-containing protein n=1 Tax=Allostreptomyces psammosilenae TaxID=1892865 RepID=A0A852ZXJ5_9ACTN|nr:DUF5709 domain-containing protein [Allostreptomyces psammosilenae]NYI05444.1 hypothetical protein [Allostreptomyces psammosilenae]